MLKESEKQHGTHPTSWPLNETRRPEASFGVMDLSMNFTRYHSGDLSSIIPVRFCSGTFLACSSLAFSSFHRNLSSLSTMLHFCSIVRGGRLTKSRVLTIFWNMASISSSSGL